MTVNVAPVFDGDPVVEAYYHDERYTLIEGLPPKWLLILVAPNLWGTLDEPQPRLWRVVIEGEPPTDDQDPEPYEPRVWRFTLASGHKMQVFAWVIDDPAIATELYLGHIEHQGDGIILKRAIVCDTAVTIDGASESRLLSTSGVISAFIPYPEFTYDTVLNLTFRLAAVLNTDVPAQAENPYFEPGETANFDPPGTLEALDSVDYAEMTSGTPGTLMGLSLVLSTPEIGIGTAEVGRETYALGPASPQTFVLSTLVTGPVMYGFSSVGENPDPFVARLLDRGDMLASGPILTKTHGETFLDQQNDAGSGRVVLDNDDTQLALVDDNSLIRFEIEGRAALTIIPREWTRQTLAESEEFDYTTMLAGPGHLALLDEAIVYPSRGIGAKPIEDERAFNWASVPYDDSGWVTANALTTQSFSAENWIGPDGAWPEEWPDPDAYWIGPHTGDVDTAPPGDNYFRTEFTVVDGACVVIFAAADNVGDVWVDGQKVMDLDTFTQTAAITLDVSNGVHTIAAHIWNAPDDDPPGDNPTGFLCSVYPANGATRLITDDVPLVRSDDSWLLCEYPPYPPGMRAGEIFYVLLEEAQARDESCLEGLTLMFDREVDSDGVPWAEVADYSTRVGNDLLTVARELADGYIDVWMAPGGLELWAWAKGGQGATPGVSFHEPTDPTDAETGNLSSLTHKRVV